MTITEKADSIRKVLERNIDTDNLFRAKRAFQGFTEVQMNNEWGQSGRSCKEILDGYQKNVDNAREMLEFYESLLHK